MNKVYIIQGSCGEYDDHTTWIYRAFTDKSKAQIRMNELNAKLKLMNMSSDNDNPSYDYSKELKINQQIMNVIDEYFCYDYTGSSYSLIEVDLEE